MYVLHLGVQVLLMMKKRRMEVVVELMVESELWTVLSCHSTLINLLLQ